MKPLSINHVACVLAIMFSGKKPDPRRYEHTGRGTNTSEPRGGGGGGGGGDQGQYESTSARCDETTTACVALWLVSSLAEVGLRKTQRAI